MLVIIVITDDGSKELIAIESGFENAQSSWLRIRGFERLAEVITGIKFTNGLTDSEIIKCRNAA